MREALKEAYKAKKIDEVPIGAVVVRNGEIIARAHNMKEHDQLASSHAEHLALTKAQKILGTWNLQDCDLYVTLEPCMMCTGLIQLSRIRRLYYGTSDPKGGCLETVIHVKQIPHLNTYPKEIYADIGQGKNTFTPLQLAQYISTVVNGGTRYKAHLVVSITDVVEGTITGIKGIGGLQTRGKYREGYPKSNYI